MFLYLFQRYGPYYLLQNTRVHQVKDNGTTHWEIWRKFPHVSPSVLNLLLGSHSTNIDLLEVHYHPVEKYVTLVIECLLVWVSRPKERPIAGKYRNSHLLVDQLDSAPNECIGNRVLHCVALDICNNKININSHTIPHALPFLLHP